MFYDNFARLCAESGKSPTAVTKDLGFSNAAASHWKNGKSPTAKSLQKIADYFGVTVNDLLSDTDKHLQSSNPIPHSAERKSYGRVQVVANVAAGVPISTVDVFDPDYPEDWEELEHSLLRSGEYFGLRIHGDSMAPDIKDGDIVIVRKQDTAEEGDLVIVTENGEWGTCKKIHFRNDGITLIPLNPAYDPIRYSTEEIRDLPVMIAGKVVRLHRDY